MPNRILLADDHAIVRQGLKALLEREGFAVVAEAGDGQEALREARERCPDVAVLDFSMPLLNGLDAAREKVGGDESAIVQPPHRVESHRIGRDGAADPGERGRRLPGIDFEDLH